LENFLTRILRRFYGACREVYVPSDSTRDALLADGLRNNFKPWPRGIDAVRFSPAKRSPAWRARYGIGPDELVILHVSRLVREKRLDTLTAALKRITVPHRVLIVGDGPDRDFVRREVPDAVFAGFLTGEDLAAAYASSDIFVFPSDSESFGNVTLEAMASGLPCVCADATGSRSLVVPDETGFLAAADDSHAFARHVTALAQDPDLRRRMGEAARRRSQSFSWEETLAKMLSYYRALLAGASPP
jgi:glycosyltransferase involved in cell wall biosynthesis